MQKPQDQFQDCLKLTFLLENQWIELLIKGQINQSYPQKIRKSKVMPFLTTPAKHTLPQSSVVYKSLIFLTKSDLFKNFPKA